jgi:hypothetical protein
MSAVLEASRDAVAVYRAAAKNGVATPRQRDLARRAFLYLGGDPARSGPSLVDYDSVRYGPFLGVSDEGTAASQIREAAFASPKVRALPVALRSTPIVVGVAVDAERLGGIGEVAVGPDEYADVWLECVDRMLVTTNVGTRVNMRFYRREPRVILADGSVEAVTRAKKEIAAAFRPFVQTPDGKPRPLTVFVDIPNYATIRPAARKVVLHDLVDFVTSGRAAGKRRAPNGQELGLATWVGLGPAGKKKAIDAIDLAASVGMRVIVIDGVKRKVADRAVSLAGLLDYFAPGLVGPILRAAAARKVRVRAANLPDADTIARSIWVGLVTARSMGAHLGKYGCFPLTQTEVADVVEQIQRWFPDWAAAPVFFVDQGLLRDDAVDIGHDLMRGIQAWLRTVAAAGVRIVLIDTIDKALGKRLLKADRADEQGFLTLPEIARLDALARELKVNVLWAGGLSLRNAFDMGRLSVFGIYVTTAAAITVPVAGAYVRDPALAGVKEPSREAVLRTKMLLEAGFLCAHLTDSLGARVERAAEGLLSAHDKGDPEATLRSTVNLAAACTTGWRRYWRSSRVEKRANQRPAPALRELTS